MADSVFKPEVIFDSAFSQSANITTVAKNDFLLHEQQLDGLLGESIQNNNRSDFSLLLAMLTEDVREHSQFFLPHTQQPKYLIQGAESDQTLRKTFKLPNAQKLSLDNMEQIKLFNQADILKNNDLANMQLQEVLTPKPLAFRDNKNFISSDVINNISLYCQSKLKNKNTKKPFNSDSEAKADIEKGPLPINKKLTVNVQGWLNTIQTSIVKSNLIVVA